MKGYYQILADLPDGDYETCVAFLSKELVHELTAAYENQFDDCDVRHFNDTLKRKYTFYFDCTQDFSDDIYGRASRVVFVVGRSIRGEKPREHQRQAGSSGSFTGIPQLEGYDKGHFIPHRNDGLTDQNLFPQLKELNRGISPQGKLYRTMERYLLRNENVFFFLRPIYSDPTWIPDQIDFGIFTKEKGLLLNRFNNRNNTF